jgi:hypothetical protein
VVSATIAATYGHNGYSENISCSPRDGSFNILANVNQWYKFSILIVNRKDNKEASGATVSSLDTSAVKQKCRLSLNLAREGLGDYRFGASSSTSGKLMQNRYRYR